LKLNIRQIIKPSSHLRSSCDENYYLETECLFGEEVVINKINNNYAFCKCSHYKYQGWIDINDLGFLSPPTHKVNVIRTFVYKHQNLKSMIIFHLPFGSQVKLLCLSHNWAEIELPNNLKGFVPARHLVKKCEHDLDWVSTAEIFLNTPYKWGGRNSFGIDCSALVQLSLQNAGVNIPRNSSEQEMMKYKNITQLGYIKRGCLVFWRGHVAISLDNNKILHANAHHMLTVSEDLIVVIKRLQKDVGNITSILDLDTTN